MRPLRRPGRSAHVAGLFTAIGVALGACSEPSTPAAQTPSTPAPTAGAAPLPLGGAASSAGSQGAAPVGGATPVGAAGNAAVAGNSAAGATATAGTAAPSEGGSGGPVGGTADWTLIGYDVASTYWNRAETKLTKDNAGSLAELWTADLIGNVYGAPLQIGDTIYGSGPSLVRAYDAQTGSEKWTAMVGSTASLAYADGTLYANDNSGTVVAIDAASGMVKWMKQPDTQRSDGSSSPVIAGDVILIGGSNGGAELSGGSFRGYMSALDRLTGDIRWTEYTVPSGANGASLWSSPSADLASNRAYGSSGNNYGTPATDSSDAIIAFDLGTGAIVWKNQRVQNDTFGGFGGGPDHDFGANPVVYEALVDGVMTELVGAGAKSGSAHAVRRDDGMLVWTRSLGGGTADGSRGIFVSSSWSGKHLLVACNEGGPSTLYALDGATGDVAWMRSLPAQVWGRISIANGVGFVGVGATLEIFDVDTGASIKNVPSKGGTVAGTITIANGRVAYGEGLSWSSGRRGQTLTVLAVP